jgi:hypothetical protein
MMELATLGPNILGWGMTFIELAPETEDDTASLVFDEYEKYGMFSLQ